MPRLRLLMSIVRWFDSYAFADQPVVAADADRVDWLRVLPFALLHLACLAVFWVGWSWTAVWVAVGLFLVRMFAITGFYHRYFSHRAFKTGRVVQFIFAFIGNSSAQRGPLWWAGHHRHHHRCSDTAEDLHSPTRQGFWRSHVTWFLCRRNFATRHDLVKNLQAYPELVFLDRFDVLAPAALLATLAVAGGLLARWAPELGTSAAQLLVWGGCLSTVALAHATFTINSLDHLWGSRRYETGDTSRNNPLLAILTLGEGWHNNHHHYPVGCRQGHRWWEIDLTYGILRLLALLGLVWDLHPVPQEVLNRDLLKPPTGTPRSVP